MALLAFLLLPIGIGVAAAFALSAVALAIYLAALVAAFVLRFFIPLGIVAIVFLAGVLVYFLATSSFLSSNLWLLLAVFVGLGVATWLIRRASWNTTENSALFFQFAVLVCLTASYQHFLEMGGFFAFVLALFSSLPFGAFTYKEPQENPITQ